MFSVSSEKKEVVKLGLETILYLVRIINMKHHISLCGFRRWFYILLFGIFLIGSGIQLIQSFFLVPTSLKTIQYVYGQVSSHQNQNEENTPILGDKIITTGNVDIHSAGSFTQLPIQQIRVMESHTTENEKNQQSKTQKPAAFPLKLGRYQQPKEEMERTKKRLSRFQRRKEELEKRKRIQREHGDVVPINEVTYHPVHFDNPPIRDVKRRPDGTIDTILNRIDFGKDDWYEQFQFFRELLASTPSLDEKDTQQWWTKYVPYVLRSLFITSRSNGETEGRFTKTYAILTNACVLPPNHQIQLFGERGSSVPTAARKTLGSPDFYFSPVETVKSTLSSDQLHSHGNHTAVFRPRSFSNIYHFLEGSSQLIHLALHPERFPAISHVIMAGQKAAWYDEWAGFMDYVYLDLFATSRRPQLHLDRKDQLLKPHQAFCDSLMVVFRNWDAEGAGYFIPEPLGADMVRAAAYKRAGVVPAVLRAKKKVVQETSGEVVRSDEDNGNNNGNNNEDKDRYETGLNSGKLMLLQIRRVNKRRVLNEEELYQEMANRFADQVFIESKVLERESAVQQVRRFAALDVLVAAHGAGLTNTIFMLPNSYLIELMPPYWDLACYRRMAENANLGYVLVRSKGKKGPQCDKNPSSQLCRRAGIRDRDFNVTIPKVIMEVERGIRFVQKRKYSV